DPEIIRSPSDPRKYRYIQLSNGLRALLISDLSLEEEPRDEEGDCWTSRRDTSERRWTGADGEGPDRWAQFFICPLMMEDAVDREVEAVDSASSSETLDTLEDWVREDPRPTTTHHQAAAALCINVGSFSDPDDLPGLAHFLEHMVFMGSQRFPEENGLDAFLRGRGGSANASTDVERTVFQLDVQKRHFREALDSRWAQFFICPLMMEDAVDREVEAVDSEFQLIRASDTHRREALLGSLARAGHPLSKFLWGGNAQTLKLEPRQKRISTYERLRLFWRRFYSAHYMTLAVQSRETLDTLEDWVRDVFVHVPNKLQPPADFSEQQQPFDTPAFNRLYRVVPVRKVHALTISWALPPQAQHYSRVKPLHSISWLIGHEGSGSVLSVLRRRCWALALFGGNSESGFDQNTTYSIFSITITLTDQGYHNFYQVIDLVFQYLKMLQTLGPQQRSEKFRRFRANEFHYQEQGSLSSVVTNICENMQLFPKEDFLTGDQLMFQYDPQVIRAALSLLTPDRANLLLFSPENEGRCSLTEKWFGTCYSVEDLSQDWVQRWAGDVVLEPLRLPAENPFIATDFSLKAADCRDSDVPVRIVQEERGALWFKRDQRFRSPRAHVRFHLVSPLVQKSPENLVLLDLFVNVLAHNLCEPAYQAQVAQLEYRLLAAQHGLEIRMKGFNHKLPVAPLLLRLIVDHLDTFGAEPGVFLMFCEQLKKTYFNILIRPERLGRDVRLLILEPSRWSLVQKYGSILGGLTLDHAAHLCGSAEGELYVEGLVQGNFTSTEARRFLRFFTERYPPPPPRKMEPLECVTNICENMQLFPKEDFLTGDQLMFQYDPQVSRSTRAQSRAEALLTVSSDLSQDWVQRWAGYQVYCSCRNTSGLLGFSVTVETQATRFSTEFVEEKIEEFLELFGRRVSSLSEEAFRAQVTALAELKEQEDAHLGEEVERHWWEVLTQQYVFRRPEKEVEALKTFTRKDLLSWFLELRSHGRKLSVHVVGCGEKEGEAPLRGSAYRDVSRLTFLPAGSPSLQDATLVTDIRAFTSSLHLHPHHKVLA
uniref:Nardilysin b (N-arginine dibasic convertase) n=1 Tax=Tetraodon nigroviridis TaxID=99883 RepID=H3CJ00_TETNG